MKKSKGQKTLFQTWKKETSTKPSLFETWDKPRPTHADKPTSSLCSSSKPFQSESVTNKDKNSLDDIVNLDDEADNDELLAAMDQMDNSCCPDGNLSFSAIPNEDIDNEIVPGFDTSTGNHWIYPTNYPVRDYQFDIVKAALSNNTLVTLPTGLGKTFIAAVVMYNFYRWFPQGKIVFMAPTRPLVAQQIEACYNIMGIPQCDTAEMTGNMAPSKRIDLWVEKRVFFLTPQVFQNDLGRGSCRPGTIVCIVIDEAHKALGNHAYCQVVRELLGYNKNFRVLALSATPGDDIKAVQQVITNLLISHIELRSEESADIKPYSNKRQVEKIVLKLGDELEYFKNKFLRVINVVVSRLLHHQVLWQSNLEKISKYLLLMAREQFRKKCSGGEQPRNKIGAIEGDFAVGISLYHAYELLIQHGLLSFYNFMKGIADGSKGISRAKAEVVRNPDFVAIMRDLQQQIELLPDRRDGNATTTIEGSPKVHPAINPSFTGHPKLKKLKEIVLEHFRSHSENSADHNTGSRIMIFSQYRDSVQEIASMFSAHKPLVRVMSFIGQQSRSSSSKGFTQKEQLEVIRKFRSGGYNTLVATCVGEEGLDIGEIDLIICFDASASPIRLVQRMGRTGRKRAGRIIVLVTEGKEEQIYERSQRNKSSIHKTILDRARTLDLYRDNPRMMPRNIDPVCQKMFMTIEQKAPKKSKKSEKKKSDGNIKKLLSKSVATKKDDGFLSPQELSYWHQHFKLPHHDAGLTPSKSISKRQHVGEPGGQQQSEHALSLTEWTAWQTSLQRVAMVSHSERTRHFTEILEFCDFRRDCGDDDDTYGLEMESFLNREDIVEPGAKTSEAHQDAGIMQWATTESNKGRKGKKKNKNNNAQVTTEKAEKNGSKENNKTKRKISDAGNNSENNVQAGSDVDECTENVGETRLKSIENGQNDKKRKAFDSEDEGLNERGGEETVTDKTKTLDEPRDQQSFIETNISRKKSFTSPKRKMSYRKRKPIQFEVDDDFEDVSFFNPRSSKETKSPECRGQPDGKGQPDANRTPMDKRSRECKGKSDLKGQTDDNGTPENKVKKHCSSESVSREGKRERDHSWNLLNCHDNSQNGLSDLLEIPSSQRHRPTKVPASEVLPDAPSLETLFDLSSLSTGECSSTKPYPVVNAADMSETPKSSRPRGKNDAVGISWKQVGCKGGLFDEGLSDEATNDEVSYINDSEKEIKSKKETFASCTSSRESGGQNVSPKGSLERYEETQDAKFKGRRPVESMCEGSLGSSNKTPCKQGERKIKEEFDNFDDDEILRGFRTPFLFDDDFEERFTKGCTSEDDKTKENIQHIDSKDGSHNFTGGKEKHGVMASNKDLPKKHSVVENSIGKNKRLQKIDSLTCERTKFEGDSMKNEVPEKSTEIEVSRKHPSEDSVMIQRSYSKCDHNGSSLAIIESERVLNIVKESTATVRNVTAGRESIGSAPQKNKPLQTVTKLGRKHDEGKHVTASEHSLTKIRSFSYEKPTTEGDQNLSGQVSKQSRFSSNSDSMNEDSDLVAPSPQKEKLHSSFLSNKTGLNMSRSILARKPSFRKVEDMSERFKNNVLKLKSRSNSSNKETVLRQQVYNSDEIYRSKMNKDRKEKELPYSAVTTKDMISPKERDSPKETIPLESNVSPKEAISPKQRISLTERVSPKETISTKEKVSPIKKVSPENRTPFNEGVSPIKKVSQTENVSPKDRITHHKNVTPDEKVSPIENVPPKHRNSSTESVSTNEPVSPKESVPSESVCIQEISSSQGFCYDNEESQSPPHNSTQKRGNEEETYHEEDSPFVPHRKVSKVKVFESEESDDDWEDNRRTFKGDESVYAIGQSRKMSHFGGNKKKRSHDTEDEFQEVEQKSRKRKSAKKDLRLTKRRKSDKQRSYANEFLEEEAEVSDDADVSFGTEGEDGDLEDSFIDDRTQLTQRSPITVNIKKNKKQVVDMMHIYRGSLMTQHRDKLRFSTPAFHRDKNRYKMVYNKAGRSSSSSQAEEDYQEMDEYYESEEDFEQMVEEEMEEERIEEEKMDEVGEGVEISPEQSQVVVRRARRRKKVLPESDVESPERSTENAKHDTSLGSPRKAGRYTRDHAERHTGHNAGHHAGHHAERVVGGCSMISEKFDNFKKPFSGMEDKMFRRPITGILPSMKDVLMNKKLDSGNLQNEEEISEILAALEESDESLMMEINDSSNCSKNCGISTNYGVSPARTPPATKSNFDNSRNITHHDRTKIMEQKSGTTNSNKPRFSEMNQNRKNEKAGYDYSQTKTGMSSLDCVAVDEIDDAELIKLTDSVSNNSENNNLKKQTISPKASSSFDQNKRWSGNKAQNSKQSPDNKLKGSTNGNFSSTLSISCTDKSYQETSEPSTSFEKRPTVNGSPDEERESVYSSPMLTTVERDKNKLTILVGSREVSNCQVISFLRRNHNIKTVVSKITGCDYIVSNRMAVDRRLVADISNPSNMNKLTVRIRELCDLYDRPCLIIEKDRLKNGETENKSAVKTKHFNRVLACLTHVKVLFSENQENTANILASLAQVEEKKNAAIIYHFPLSKEKEQIVKFLSSIPRTSYITAVSLSFHHKTILDIINSSAEDLVKRTKNLSLKRANDIINFLHHGFRMDMVSGGTT